MEARPCPSCHEIIPADVDYCPFCGNSTRETLETEEDRIAVANAERLSEAMDEAAEVTGKLPPSSGQFMCMMCHNQPATIGDYCADCKEKLEMGPEQWDLMKQDQARRNTMLLILVAIMAVLAITFAILRIHSHRTAPASSSPAVLTIPLDTRYRQAF